MSGRQPSLSRRGIITLAAAAAFRAPIAMADMPGIKELTARGRLRVAVPAFGSPPFFHELGSAWMGTDTLLAMQLSASLNLPVEFDRSAESFNAAVDLVATNKVELAVCKLSRTLQRARSVRFTAPYVLLEHALIVNRVRFARMMGTEQPEATVRRYDEDLGVIADSAFVDFARHNFPNATVRSYPSWEEVIEAVKTGKIAAAYRDEFEVKRLLIDDPSMTISTRTMTLTDLTDSIAIAVAPDLPDLLEYTNLYLADTNEAKPRTADQLLRIYARPEHHHG